MKKPNHDLTLKVGQVSDARELGKFYQDFSNALHHFDEDYFGDKDENGLPMYGFGENAVYHQIFIIQYGLISYDLILDGVNVEENTSRFKAMHSVVGE